MPDPCSTSVSALTLASPVVPRWAPAGFTELAQPLPLAPLLPHGQLPLEPSPPQKFCTTPPPHASHSPPWMSPCVLSEANVQTPKKRLRAPAEEPLEHRARSVSL